MPTDLARLRLAEEISTLEYRQYGVAWLKVMPVAHVVDGRVVPRGEVLDAFLKEHLNLITPEDTPYTALAYSPWTSLDHTAMEAILDEILARTEATRARDAAVHAADVAMALDGDYPPPMDPWQDSFSDYPALRRWFTQELWPGEDTSFWRCVSGEVRAVAAVDDLLVGVIWL